ncbi:MAG TPA: hypothetical protein VLX61_03015 [Anaerolineales bacterium]|nr:hypothetical protein [Anaerolineales bacterium]
MDFLKKFFSRVPTAQRKRYYIFEVKCNRCGEIVEGRLDLQNDLSVEYEGDNASYFGRKVLMGSSGQCFQQIEVELKFDVDKKVSEKRVAGGQFVKGD